MATINQSMGFLAHDLVIKHWHRVVPCTVIAIIIIIEVLHAKRNVTIDRQGGGGQSAPTFHSFEQMNINYFITPANYDLRESPQANE